MMLGMTAARRRRLVGARDRRARAESRASSRARAPTPISSAPGRERILLDTGQGMPAYLPVLERRTASAPADGIQEIVLTHGHPDHIGGVAAVLERYRTTARLEAAGTRAWTRPGRSRSRRSATATCVRTEGATLRAIHTPGHAEDHLCFVLEEERALFSGDNVLGVGTTVIPGRGRRPARLHGLARAPARASAARDLPRARPADRATARAKIREYIAHRNEREARDRRGARAGLAAIPAIVERVYAAYPECAARRPRASSVASHLLKLEREGRVRARAARRRSTRVGVGSHDAPGRSPRCASATPEQRRAACVAAADDPSAVLLVDRAGGRARRSRCGARSARRNARARADRPRAPGSARRAARGAARDDPRRRIEAALTWARLEPPPSRAVARAGVGARGARGRRRALARGAPARRAGRGCTARSLPVLLQPRRGRSARARAPDGARCAARARARRARGRAHAARRIARRRPRRAPRRAHGARRARGAAAPPCASAWSRRRASDPDAATRRLAAVALGVLGGARPAEPAI